MLLDSSDKPKFLNPNETALTEYISKVGRNARSKGLAMACGQKGGEFVSIDEYGISEYEVSNPAYCLGNVTSIGFQGKLVEGVIKNPRIGRNNPKGILNNSPETNPVKTVPKKPEGLKFDSDEIVKSPKLDKRDQNPQKPLEIPCVVSGVSRLEDNALYAFVFGVRAEAGCGVDIKELTTKLNNIKNKQNNEVTLEGARKELRGENSGVWNDPTQPNYGQNILHLQKVREGLQGLRNSLDDIERELDRNKTLTKDEINSLETLKRDYTDEIDRVEREVPGI